MLFAFKLFGFGSCKSGEELQLSYVEGWCLCQLNCTTITHYVVVVVVLITLRNYDWLRVGMMVVPNTLQNHDTLRCGGGVPNSLQNFPLLRSEVLVVPNTLQETNAIIDQWPAVHCSDAQNCISCRPCACAGAPPTLCCITVLDCTVQLWYCTVVCSNIQFHYITSLYCTFRY